MIGEISKAYAISLMESIDNNYKEFFEESKDVSLNLCYEIGLQELQIIEKILEDEKIYKFLTHPNIDLKEKQEIINSSLMNLNRTIVCFLNVIIENKRLDEFNNIVKVYTSLLDEKKGIIRFEITTNFELSEEMYQKIIKTLEDDYQKKVIAKTIIDSTIIGGIVVARDGYIIDNTVLNKLRSIKDMVLSGE